MDQGVKIAFLIVYVIIAIFDAALRSSPLVFSTYERFPKNNAFSAFLLVVLSLAIGFSWPLVYLFIFANEALKFIKEIKSK
jgi:hypothetical protein